jgi:hypothetical protein
VYLVADVLKICVCQVDLEAEVGLGCVDRVIVGRIRHTLVDFGPSHGKQTSASGQRGLYITRLCQDGSRGIRVF